MGWDLKQMIRSNTASPFSLTYVKEGEIIACISRNIAAGRLHDILNIIKKQIEAPTIIKY